jgi:hypothetical protein
MMSEENNSISKANEENSNKKFLRGDYGLPFTFWGGGVGVTFVSLFFIISLLDEIGSDSAAYLSMVFFFFYSIFISIAIWRATNQYAGPMHWGVFAKIAIILMFGLVMFIYMYIVAMFNSPPMH